MKKMILAAVAALGFAAPALAADAGGYAAMRDWSGAYLGLQAGYGWGDSRASAIGGVPTTGDFDISGGLGGYTSGYNWQSGEWVFGIESDTSISGIDGATPVSCVTLCSTEIDWLSTLRARLGWATGDFLPYITGGLAYGKVVAGFPGTSFSVDDVKFGWAAGAGVEVALNQDWSFKFEYLHIDLGDITHPVGPVVFEADDINIVRAGLNYRFDLLGYLFN